ncbi:hypothetical protein LCGC14_0598080 [marine sediment metagenome]|uniref:DUF7736 domain-containing protein n=1 Tax=marine sediment metagenome TaxID=412755 RepID=A0A0F9RG99_9ZZZZ
MTEREMVIVSAYTGVLLGRFCDMHEYIEQIMERPVSTHELGNKRIMEEIRCRSKRDFCNLDNKLVPKPLAQYLDEYLRHEVVDVDRELLEQALDAYQSTENVTIKIERN